MASIKKRMIRWQTKDGQERSGERWQARYRDEAGKEHAKMFRRKVDAKQWLDEITASIVTGQYVNPKAGKVTFQRFYADWSARQVWVPSTRVNSDRAAASVPFSDMPMKAIRKSHVELFVKRMSADGLAASTIKTRFVMLRAVMRGAVADRIIPADPTIGVRLPRQAKREDSWSLPTEDQVGALVEKARPEFRAFVALCAFAGLRSGESCGVQVGDIDFLRRELHVRRQIQGDFEGEGDPGTEVRIEPDCLSLRRTGDDPVRARRGPHAGRGGGSLALHNRRGEAAGRERGHLQVEPGADGREGEDRPAP